MSDACATVLVLSAPQVCSTYSDVFDLMQASSAICLRYMPKQHTYTICLCYLRVQYAYATSPRYLSTLPPYATSLRYIPTLPQYARPRPCPVVT